MRIPKSKLQFFLGFLLVIAFLIWISVFYHSSADESSNLKIYFLNVGQGDGEYIKLPDGKDILIDGGPDSSVLAELGKVMNLGDRKINLVILTHPHADHLTGLIDVVNRYQIDEVWETGVEYQSSIYEQWQKEIKDKNIKNIRAVKGLAQDFDGVKISVLYPLSPLKKIDNLNNASIIAELDFNQFSTLFMGDAEIEAQSQILDLIKHNQVLKMAHHGSSNGANKDFLNIVRPNFAVIEVGKGNTYGHPTQTTIDLLKRLATQIYRTDQNGTIEIISDGLDWQVKTEH